MRHLDESQRASIAGRIADLPHGGSSASKFAAPPTQARAAAAVRDIRSPKEDNASKVSTTEFPPKSIKLTDTDIAEIMGARASLMMVGKRTETERLDRPHRGVSRIFRYAPKNRSAPRLTTYSVNPSSTGSPARCIPAPLIRSNASSASCLLPITACT